MPVKNAPSRRIKFKKAPAPKSVAPKIHDEDEVAPVVILKTKMPIELDEPEVAIAVEEKTEDELLNAEEETDELGLDDAGLEEELDPFNDKWEA